MGSNVMQFWHQLGAHEGPASQRSCAKMADQNLISRSQICCIKQPASHHGVMGRSVAFDIAHMTD